jgi:tRNA A-37 threonylcarbamoyl transferase component Bud32/CheY-like chemotaxis protein
MAGKGSVLIVSGDEMAQMLLGNYLKGLRYDVELVEDPCEAVEIAREKKPDIAIDQRFEGAEHSLVELFEGARLDIPVLVLVGEGPAEGDFIGAVEVLPWPVTRPEVAEAIARVLPKQRAQRAIKKNKPLFDDDTMPAVLIFSAHEGEGDDSGLGGYRVEKLIGRGGMGNVYKAWDSVRQQVVAIKTIRCEGDDSSVGESSQVDRFRIEAEALARLAHPRIVATMDFGRDRRQGVVFMVMEFVDGPPLSHRLREGRLSVVEALTIAWDLADALAYAHGEGVIHRDVKPGNVLLDSLGRPVLTDFGLARIGTFTVSGGQAVAGTPTYMPPEQMLNPQAIDGRVDQFALGALLQEMLTGQPCFAEDRLTARLFGAVDEKPSLLRDLGVQGPSALQQMVYRMTSRSPDDRYLTDQDLLTALRAVGRAVGLEFERAPLRPRTSHTGG